MNPAGKQHVVEHVQIVDQLEILKDLANVLQPKEAAFIVVQAMHVGAADLNFTT